MAEDRFNGPYNVAIINNHSVPTAGNGGAAYPFVFNLPCFVIQNSLVSNTHANILTFTGDNAANGKPLSFPDAGTTGLTPAKIASGGSACHSGELEVAAIPDGKGHVVNFYYEEL